MARVLMIEDDDIFAEIAMDCLEAAGHMVSVVEHGDTALDAVVASNPDLLILDHNLPGRSGISILRAVRELPHTAGMSIMMLTAKTGKLLPALAHDGGADDYVPKPVAPDMLLRRLEALLAGAKLARQVIPAASFD